MLQALLNKIKTLTAYLLNVRVEVKIIGIAVGISLFALLVGVKGLMNMSEINRMSARIYQKEMICLSRIKDAYVNLICFARAEKNVMLSFAQKDRRHYLAIRKTNEDAYLSNIRDAERLLETPREKAILAKLENAWSAYSIESNRVIDLAIGESLNRRRPSIEAAMGPAREKINTVIDALDELTRLKEANAKALSDKTAAIYKSSQFVLTAVIGGGVVLAIGLGILLTFAITGPMKKAEKKLRDANTIQSLILENSTLGIALVRNRNFVWANSRLAELIGMPLGKIQEASSRVLYPSQDAYETMGKQAYPLLAEGKRSDITLQLVKSDGTLFWCRFIGKAIDPTAPHEGSIWMFEDISERKRTETELTAAHAKITSLINAISSILIAVSDDDRIVFWNTEAEKQFGITEHEVIGARLRELPIQWDCEQIMEGIRRCRKENEDVGADPAARTNVVLLNDVKFLQRSGKDGILGLRISPTFGEQSFSMEIMIQGANITKRKIMEHQLSQAQKLESIGQLAAGIAHEINTPTQYVGDNVRFLKNSFVELNAVFMQYEALRECLKTGNPHDALLKEIEGAVEAADVGYLLEEVPRAFQQTLEGIERVSRIVQSMKAFAHSGSPEKTLVDLNKAIETTLLVARNEWKYVADLVTELDPSLPLVPCIQGDINQVILNVIVNAAQAIAEAVDGSGGKGNITITTLREGPWAEIRVSDTGKGIPEAIRSRIFDPFFTTKAVGKGTGQGLAISHAAVVERHGGSITFETENGQGTTFIIRLPVEEATYAGTK